MLAHLCAPPRARLLQGERVMEVAAISDSTGDTSFKRRSPRRPALRRIMTGAMTVAHLNNCAALMSERQPDLDPVAFIPCRLWIKWFPSAPVRFRVCAAAAVKRLKARVICFRVTLSCVVDFHPHYFTVGADLGESFIAALASLPRRRRRAQHVDMTNLTFYLTLLSTSAFPSRCLFTALVYLLNFGVVGSIHNGSERRKDCAAALTSHLLFKDTDKTVSYWLEKLKELRAKQMQKPPKI